MISIKEIPFPYVGILDEILEKREKDARRRRMRCGKFGRGFLPIKPKKPKPPTVDYIRFDRDRSFVDEFIGVCGIEPQFAEEILTIFFDEVKKNMLQGNIIWINEFGKFYLGISNYQKYKVLPEINPKYIFPRLKLGKKLINVFKRMSYL